MTHCQVHIGVWFPGVECRFVKPRPWGHFCRHGWIYSCFSVVRMWRWATVPNPGIELIGPDTTANVHLISYLWGLGGRMRVCLVSCSCLCLTFVTGWIALSRLFLRLDEELWNAGNGCRIITFNCQWDRCPSAVKEMFTLFFSIFLIIFIERLVLLKALMVQRCRRFRFYWHMLVWNGSKWSIIN